MHQAAAAHLAEIRKIIADLAVLQGDRNLVLLNHPGVLDDLDLSPDQRARFSRIQVCFGPDSTVYLRRSRRRAADR